MAHKEYGVTDILDILRRKRARDGIRRIVRATGTAKNTVRNYLRIAAEHGFDDTVPDDRLSEIAAAVFREVHGGQKKPAAPGACAPLLPHRELLSGWLEKDGLTLTKAHIKLGRMRVDVSYSTLYRYARETLGFGGPKVTVRMAVTEPGEVAQVDFGRMGLVFDPETDKNRVLHALVVTLVFSRHQYVYLTHRQDLDALVAGIEEAWEFFCGVTRRLIIDNLKAAVVKADRYEPVFNRTFQEYSQHRGFIIDPAVVRHPEGKATVENQVKYVRENFFKGESFTDRMHAQREAERWCRTTAGLRLHGTTRKRPLLVFEQVEVKGTSSLVRVYCQSQLIKTHPKAAAGKRCTDFDDYPKEKSAYAMRDVAFYIRKAQGAGEKLGAFMAELLSGDVPWTYIRQAQQLLRLIDKYGAVRLEAACGRALAFGLMNVSRVERIVKQSLEQPSATPGRVTTTPPARFVRDASYFNHSINNHTTEEDDNGDYR